MDDDAAVARSAQLPKVSIVVNNYNYERFVGAAVASALSQDYPNLEVVIVDDGSEDESKSIISGFANDPRVKPIFQDNGGQAAAMNTGFFASTGDIIVFLDSDDILKQGVVQSVVDAWETGISRIQFLLETIDEEGGITGLHPFSQHAEFGDVHWEMAVGGIHRFMPTSGNAFARGALEPIFPIDEKTWRICADTYLVTASTAFGRVKLLREILGQYRIHSSNRWYASSRGEERRREIWLLYLKAWTDFLRFINPDDGAGLSAAELRRIRDAAKLYTYRRILTGYLVEPGTAPAGETRRIWRAALRCAITASAPFRHKLLYLGAFLIVRPSRRKIEGAVQWTVHTSFRPAGIRWLVEKLKGPSFYAWMRRRAKPSPLPTLPIGRTFRFGRMGGAEPMFWYGFTVSDQWVSWVIGAESALIAQVPPESGDLHFTVEVYPRLTKTVKAQRLSILANGVQILSDKISEYKRISFALPRSLWADTGELVLVFKTPDFLTPRFLEPPHEDLRPLCFSFHWAHIGKTATPAVVEARPHAPLDKPIDLENSANARYLDKGWRALSDGSVRMRYRLATIRATLLDAAASVHLFGIEFRRENLSGLSRSDVEVSVNGGPPKAIDLATRSRIDILLPQGKIEQNGHIEIRVTAASFVSGLARGIAGDEDPAGPAIRSLLVRRIEPGSDRPVFQPGEAIDFRAGGNAGPFLAGGWHRPETTGTRTADLVAAIEGIWLDRDEVAFLTATLFPPMSKGPLSAQHLKLSCNGVRLANYAVASPAEVTAIIPAGTVGEDGIMRIEFHVSNLLRPSDIEPAPDRRLLGLAVAALKVDSLGVDS